MRCSRPRHPACRQRWTVAEAATEEGRKGKGRALTLSGVRALRKRSIAQANRHTEDEHKRQGGMERSGSRGVLTDWGASPRARLALAERWLRPTEGPLPATRGRAESSAADRNEVRTL